MSSKDSLMVRGRFYMTLVFSLLGLILILLAALIGTHRDTASYLTVAVPIATALLSQLVISKQVYDVKQVADRVEHQTNGALQAQFADLKDHVDNAVGNNDE